MPKLKTRTPQDHQAKGVTPMESIPQGAERWGVSPDWIRKLIAAGDLKIYRCGRVIRFRPEDLDALFTVYGGES